jgi:hypothetical protein
MATAASPTPLLSTSLADFHPIFIEGMGARDPRDPDGVSDSIVESLGQQQLPSKPLIFVIQGDPRRERGISAITSIVAERYKCPRCLVCLDESISKHHSRNADRENVAYELRYSQMVDALASSRPDLVIRIEASIDQALASKNERRKLDGKSELPSYCKTFALLQEVTKAAFVEMCGDLTLVHTYRGVDEFSVTSFYQTGLDLGLIGERNIIPYPNS